MPVRLGAVLREAAALAREEYRTMAIPVLHPVASAEESAKHEPLGHVATLRRHGHCALATCWFPSHLAEEVPWPARSVVPAGDEA